MYLKNLVRKNDFFHAYLVIDSEGRYYLGIGQIADIGITIT